MIIESMEDMTGREAEIALRAYTGHTDRSAGRAIELTLRAIVQMNAETVAETKGELPMWGGVLLERGKDGDKVTKIPISFTAVMGDHDAGTISVKTAGAMLDAAGVAGAILETASSTPEHPRWRAVIPMSGPLSADEHREMVSKLNTALEGSLAPESWSTKQGYYYGHIKGSRTPESVMVVGATLDLLKIRGTPCLLAPNRSLGDTAASARSVADEFDIIGAQGGVIPGTERPSNERVATTALKTGENLHSGILAATHLVAIGEWPEQFTLDAFTVAATATRGPARAANIAHEWRKALEGAEKYVGAAQKKQAGVGSKLLVPFRFSPVLVVPPTSIRDYLPADGIGLIWGEPSSFKSFVALDMGLSIAWGDEWHGRPTKKGTIWYLAGEGQAGIERRIRAWAVEHGKIDEGGRPLDISDRFLMTPKSILVNGTDGEPTAHMETLVALIQSGHSPSHIFVDTIARTMSGDENTSKDMGAYIRGLEMLVDAIREKGEVVCVAAVHHSRKDGAMYRGSSALRGAMDFEFEVARDGMKTTVKCHKMKDFAEPDDEVFLAVEVPLGQTTNEWGEIREVKSLTLKQDPEAILASGMTAMQERFEPYRKAIEENPNSGVNKLFTVMKIAKKTFVKEMKEFEEAEWVTVVKTPDGHHHDIGPKAPVGM